MYQNLILKDRDLESLPEIESNLKSLDNFQKKTCVGILGKNKLKSHYAIAQ
jgi:hypothetical protein